MNVDDAIAAAQSKQTQKVGGIMSEQRQRGPPLPVEQESVEDVVVITLSRSAGEGTPWGIVVNDATMRMEACLENSVAARSDRANACVGMVQ